MAKIVKMGTEPQRTDARTHPLVEIMKNFFPGLSEEQIIEIHKERLTERQFERLFGVEMEKRKREYDRNRPSLCDMTQPSQQYVLAITIEGCPVRVYRQLEVPSNIRLEHLARIIIGIIGWYGGHLYHFRKDTTHFVPPEVYEDEDYVGVLQYDAMAYTLGDVLNKKGGSIRFVYDLGDDWQHKVRLSSVKPLNEPRCVLLRGAGCCPPEDCGGVWGYAEMLESGEYEPEDFDLEDAQAMVEDYVSMVSSPDYKYCSLREDLMNF